MFFRLLRKWCHKLAARPIRRHLRAFEEATHFPREWQEHLLQRIANRQAETDFGCHHHFSSIRTAALFQRRVPIAPYEYVEPYITRVRQGDFRALLSKPAVHMFALTSG